MRNKNISYHLMYQFRRMRLSIMDMRIMYTAIVLHGKTRLLSVNLRAVIWLQSPHRMKMTRYISISETRDMKMLISVWQMRGMKEPGHGSTARKVPIEIGRAGNRTIRETKTMPCSIINLQMEHGMMAILEKVHKTIPKHFCANGTLQKGSMWETRALLLEKQMI